MKEKERRGRRKGKKKLEIKKGVEEEKRKGAGKVEKGKKERRREKGGEKNVQLFYKKVVSLKIVHINSKTIINQQLGMSNTIGFLGLK